MKIAILSDFHIGYERFRADAYSQAEEALEKASSVADALLIPGDIFDYRHPKSDVIAEAIHLFRNLSKKKFAATAKTLDGKPNYTSIPVIAIPGTHERRADSTLDPIDVLSRAALLLNDNKAQVMG